MKRRVTTTMVLTVVTALLMVGTAGALCAASQPPPGTPGRGEFVPITTLPPVEQLPAAPFLIGAYVVVWLVLLVYVWSIWRRMKKMERELADLQRRVQSR
ncbi:MAG: heme exporter protein CcmD [Acidobacteria bacterium]|nr:heme exporter protein CcmD [Acidobacteriota bacterium]